MRDKTTEQPDRAVPSANRQDDLEQDYAKNLAEGNAPYQDVIIRTLGELEWVMEQRNWSGDLLPHAAKERADLSGVRLEGNRLSHVSEWGINLSGVRLWGANLAGAKLWRANLTGADLTGADLSAANVSGANFTNANLNHANLSNANLGGANLSGTILIEATLNGAYLGSCRLDVETMLSEAVLDSTTCLADVVWNNAPLTRVNWSSVPTLGDEGIAREQTPHHFPFQSPAFTFSGQKDNTRRREDYEAAARAYR